MSQHVTNNGLNRHIVKIQPFMKLPISILLFCTSLLAYSQQDSLMLPASWMGTIKMGNSNPALVFTIEQDSLGQPSGTLGLPSKGIQGVPLSTVAFTKDSVFFEIAAAQADYKGLFNKNRTRIQGIWTEGNNTYPLILKPLTTDIDYSSFKKENASSFPLQLTSAHFNLYSEKDDAQVLEALSNVLESNYQRITTNMQTRFDSKIKVFIYPNLTSFHTAINYKNAPDWVVGAAGKNELKMVSPLHPGPEHSYKSLMKAIVHELAHTVVLNLRKQGAVGIPKWLHEGYAYYEANQLTEAERKQIYSNVTTSTLPSWKQLAEATTAQFGDMGGYGLSATIVAFLINTYGIEKLHQLMLQPKSVEKIYTLPNKELEIAWLEYLKTQNTANKK